MRKVLLATAAVAVLGLSATGASADYWATANINFGPVTGNLTVDYGRLGNESSMSVGNMGALTVNENEENIDVRIKGPVVEINVDQTGAHNNQTNNSGTGKIGQFAPTLAVGAVIGYKVDSDIGADQDVWQSNDDNDNYNYQGGNYSLIYVEDQLGGLLDCGCSSDDFYTVNINKGSVSGDLYAHKLDLNYESSVSVGNIGAATINKSTNNMDIRVGRSYLR